MNAVKILLLNLTSCENQYSQDVHDALNYLKRQEDFAIEEYCDPADISEEKLAHVSVFLLCADNENSNCWQFFAEMIENSTRLSHLGFVLVCCSRNHLEIDASEILSRGLTIFACPFNYLILEAHIRSLALDSKYQRSLDHLATSFNKSKDLKTLAKIALKHLQHHPEIGFTRACISLVDVDTEERYLLRHEPKSPTPDRELLRPIQEDTLISQVVEETVLILENIQDLRANRPDVLQKLGWIDTDTTADVNSWIGIAAKRQNDCVAIITLDNKKPGKYSRHDDKLLKFLGDFADILAEAIICIAQQRNARVVREISQEIGNALESEVLMKRILSKLKDELGCDNCTYFNVLAQIEKREMFLEEWVNAIAQGDSEKEQKRAKRSFKEGEGVVGATLADGKSRIVPHALECEEFEPTRTFTGSKLSMLIVPVIPYARGPLESRSNRIIGVISCYKTEKDHFTVYDRELLETIAQSTATVIERTMALEYSNDISNTMNNLVLRRDKTHLLRKICEHALRVTSARAAVIYRLKRCKSDIANQYWLTGECYAFPETIRPRLPRLDGEGTTNEVIREKRTVEFSEQNGKYELIPRELRDKGIKYQIVVPLKITEDARDEPTLIGALYLNKYSPEPFTKVEKFALELFASQAASTIYHQEFLAERMTWTKANTDLAAAIEVIASTEEPDILLKEIVSFACSLSDATFSYLALVNNQNRLDLKAAWPEYIISELSAFKKSQQQSRSEKKGIVGLVAETGKTILVGDIQNQMELSPEFASNYINFRKGTRSELAVPIKENTSGKIIGVINLEHEQPYAFTEVHKEVIEHFARQVAIAFQKKRLLEASRNKKNILIGLQRSLQKINESTPQNMLANAVLLTREAVGAEAVFVVPIEQRKWKYVVLEDEITPTLDGFSKTTIRALKELSVDVFKDTAQAPRLELMDMNWSTGRSSMFSSAGMSLPRSRLCLCIPFSSRDFKAGVMWIVFPEGANKGAISTEEIAMYQAYSSQIALAYTNAKRSEILKQKLARNRFELTANIDKNYKDARHHANVSFLVSVCTSLIGLALIFYSFSNILRSSPEQPQEMAGRNGISIVVGVMLQAVTVLAFSRGEKANERMDKYHRELYNVRQLEILLSATEQLDPNTALEVKQEIVKSAADRWIQNSQAIEIPAVTSSESAQASEPGGS